MIPQGSSSTYAMIQVRELIGTFLGLDKSKSKEQEDTNEDKNNQNSNQNINFVSQMKK